jgi:hypothetical protein
MSAPQQRRGVLVPLTPSVLNEPDAAAYLARSASWMRQRRFQDMRLIRRGEPPTGPTWIQVESSILYRVADLDAWLAAKAVERGQVEFRGHLALPTPAGEVDPHSPTPSPPA